MIAASPEVGYISEPFNLSHRPGICGAKFDYWFTYITHENAQRFYGHIKRTIDFSYNMLGGLQSVRGPKDAAHLLIDYYILRKYRRSSVRPLIKDPIAVLSAEWLVSTFDMDPIVLIRHPAAFASSLKLMNWTHPFSHFLQQPLLMRDHLHPFESEIRKHSERSYDIIDQAILLWRVIHYVVMQYQKKHRDWVFIRHEDLSSDPISGFQTLFDKLGLRFSEHIKDVVREHSNSPNPSEVPMGGNPIKRDSKETIWNWKRRLTKSDIKKIREETADLSSVFYSDDDW